MVEGDAKPLRAESEDNTGHRREPFWARWKGSKGEEGKGLEGGGKWSEQQMMLRTPQMIFLVPCGGGDEASGCC